MAWRPMAVAELCRMRMVLLLVMVSLWPISADGDGPSTPRIASSKKLRIRRELSTVGKPDGECWIGSCMQLPC